MQREVWEVQQRCDKCGSVLRALVHESGLDDNGDEYEAIYVDRVPHTARDCERMQELAREEWPTLW